MNVQHKNKWYCLIESKQKYFKNLFEINTNNI